MSNLIKFNPFVPSKSVQSFFDDVFNRNIGDWVGRDFFLDTPSVNIMETDLAYKVELAAPGLEKNDFNIQVEGDYLKITASKEGKKEEKQDNYVRREFNYTSFERSFRLPETVKADKIAATYDNGVLKVELPKKEAAQKEKSARVIEIA